MEESNGKGRRDFLRGTVAAAGGLLIVKPETAFGSQANSAVEIGLIGCGGRGNWITDFFIEYAGARVVALADAFDGPLKLATAKYKIDPKRAYSGLNGYRELVASRLDGVAIETPPLFHPEQAEAAVNAGKHVYMAKPVATDAQGSKRVIEAARKAKGKLSYLVDFQTRSQPAFQEAAARVHRGEIGELGFAHVYYHAGALKPKDVAGLTPEQATLRNWVFDRRISGDIIVEQNVHVLDVANWYLRGHPLHADGACGQKVRKFGNCSDHFMVNYFYADGMKVDFSSAQFTVGYGDLCIRLYGSEGTVDSHYGGLVEIKGKRPWKGADKDPTFKDGAVANVKAWVESIRTGKLLNNGETGAESTLTAVLGRMAAYRERTVTWDEMMRTNEPFDGKMKG